MKVAELIFVERQLIAPSEFDRRGTAMKLPNMYKNVNYGDKSHMKTSAQTVTVRSTKKGQSNKIYGRRTLYQK